jgi:hypothetical protein
MNPALEKDVARSHRLRISEVPARSSDTGRVSANGSNCRARTSS